METLTGTGWLRGRIDALENKREQEELELRKKFKEVQEVLKPANLIKSAIKDFSESPDLKNNLVNSVIGMTAGFAVKKAAIGSTGNPIKLILGNLLEHAVAGTVTKNSDTIKATLVNLVKGFLNKDKPNPTTNEENKDERN